jgi:DNA-binding CsgD family transcriptional regulator
MRERSHRVPCLLVVDDVQWLDGPTATVLAFAARRLHDEPIGFLVAQRADPGGPTPLGLDRGLEPQRLHRITLGPISLGALQAMLRARLDRSFPRPVLQRIHETSGGNPFFALEIAKAIEREGATAGPGASLPVPQDLEKLLGARIGSLPAGSRRVLLFIAASPTPTPELIAFAAGSGSHDDVAAAAQAGVVEIASDRVRFTHPLLASTVYSGASPSERRAAHRALADHAGDPEERARHLALSSDGPDPAIADALDEAARLARTRAAPDSAAELSDLARELTPTSDIEGRQRRGLEAAGHHFDAGDVVRAQEKLLELSKASPPGPARAAILLRLAQMCWNEVDRVRSHLEAALENLSGDTVVGCHIRSELAWTGINGGDLADAQLQAQISFEIAERIGDPSLTSEALATLGLCEFLAGRDGGDRIALAVSIQRTGSVPDVYTTPHVVMGLRHLWAGELDEARSTLESVLAYLADRGLYTLATEPYEYLGEIECRAGRYERAAERAVASIETELAAGFELGGIALYPQALVDACRGDVDSAREQATHGLLKAEEWGDLLYANCHRAVLGFIDLSLGRFAEAREHLDQVIRFLREMGVTEPCVIPVHADAVEARIGSGDVEGAEGLLMELEKLGRSSGRPWALATAARCRGMLLVSRGDAEAAEPAFDRAIAEHERVGQPLELGRTLLAKGEAQRRARQRSAARESIGGALAIFEDLGAAVWAERARTELARIGGRTPAGDELTLGERRIAELVAEGKRNKEVASILVVSERTVESALTQIYRKLGVRSRTELARALQASD